MSGGRAAVWKTGSSGRFGSSENLSDFFRILRPLIRGLEGYEICLGLRRLIGVIRRIDARDVKFLPASTNDLTQPSGNFL
jgi:hypothetical protein